MGDDLRVLGSDSGNAQDKKKAVKYFLVHRQNSGKKVKLIIYVIIAESPEDNFSLTRQCID